MSIPPTLIKGSIAYAVVGVACIVAIMVLRASGSLSKDNAAIGNVVVSIATFSMWLFWLCAWMHQWHPLIVPIYEGSG